MPAQSGIENNNPQANPRKNLGSTTSCLICLFSIINSPAFFTAFAAVTAWFVYAFIDLSAFTYFHGQQSRYQDDL